MIAQARRILQVVHDSQAGEGVTPSIRRIGELVQLSPGVIHYHLTALERAGFIRRLPRKSRRGIEVVRLPGNGLSAAELAWCQANVGRVRAMMAVCGEGA